MNSLGTPENLVPSHPGNTNAVKHGVYSRMGRVLAPRAEEIARELLTAPHVSRFDTVAAEELGAMIALAEAMDAELAANGLVRRGDARSLVKLRLQLSRRIAEWLHAFGMTPQARAQFARELAAGETLADSLRRRREGESR